MPNLSASFHPDVPRLQLLEEYAALAEQDPPHGQRLTYCSLLVRLSVDLAQFERHLPYDGPLLAALEHVQLRVAAELERLRGH